ncbi:MAG: flagellar biosynthetic protein FliR [Deltaproteobacteria bacterium]|nr:flagellar biosynthetic protein FliR [Deltaproteobacteria bacterium]MBW2245628.1 flagellar biosynthetic protein FliR [Deltaproteobacteria bacterium]MBW2639796.1 flagellar biosynthetic protein FliR [Deltaproteobacteria bacterium]
MDILTIPYQEYKAFFLVLIRVSAILVMFPFFSARVIPTLIKAGLALMITIVLFPVINNQMVAFPGTLLGVAQLILAELIIGMTLGLMVQIFFEGVRMMGQMVGFQTGFAITNVLDPQSGMQVSIFANTAYLLAIVLFLLLNGHHILLNAVKSSFDIINVGSFGLNVGMLKKMTKISGDMFVIAVKIGAPPIAALLFTNVAFGLITKLMPQMNIMIVAFPVQICIGLFFFGISLNVLLGFMKSYVEGLGPLLINSMNWFKV